jgi:AcrR family transcriptional regulator
MTKPSRKRLTREDSRDQTTQRLLDAAQKVIAKKGLAGASVEDIAEAAGYSRGAFYSNFKSKSDLFIDLLRRDHERINAEFFAMKNDELSLDQIQEGMRAAYGKLYQDNEHFMNWTEARMLSARDARFRAKLNSLMVEKRDEIVGFIDYFYKRAGTSPTVPLASMAMGFMILVEGVKLFTVSCPNEMTPEVAESVLTLFIDSIMQVTRLRAAGVVK